MNFRFLFGDVNWETYGGTFISRRLNNNEFDYWLVLEVTPGFDEASHRYYTTLSIVAPSQCPYEKRLDALHAWGVEEEVKAFFEQHGDLALVEILYSYGIRAEVWGQGGNNLKKLLQAVRQEADKIELLFGFYMDNAQNALGATGWDFIMGNPLGSWAKSFHVENI